MTNDRQTGATHDPRSKAEAEQAEKRDRLIEAIYRIALDPQSYDSFVQHWGGFVSTRVAGMDEADGDGEAATRLPEIDEFDSHFAMANKLLEDSMPPPTDDGEAPASSGENRSAPRFLVNGEGRIVWYNAAAERLIGFHRGAKIDMLDISDERRADLNRMVEALDQSGAAAAARPQVFHLGSKPTERPMHFQARVITEGSGGEVILISKLSTIWPPGTIPLLRDNFGLTPSEIDVCEWIADGHSATQIATLRNASVATVRTQIKRVMGKTRTTAQAELVRLLHLLIRIAEDNPDRAALRSEGAGLQRIALPDGRTMPVEIHGPDDGSPVIFFHGMLDGNAITNHCRDLLFRHKLRLLCPVRPWFGSADPDHADPDTAPERFARDIQVMISTMKLTRPMLLAHMGGALYAFAAAATAPAGQLVGIVSVSGGVPILGSAQFSTMSARQRVVAYTARYAPRALPFLLRAGIRQMRTGGERKFLMSLYEHSPHDLPLISDPEVQDIVLNGYRFTVAQGHRAFEIDSHHVVEDWSRYVAASDIPVRLIHGETDPVVSVTSVQDFADRLGHRATLTVLPNTGQLVFYRSSDLVLQSLQTLRNQSQED